MPRTRLFAVALAASLAAGGYATAAFAVAQPVDRDVLTNVQLPLSGSGGSGDVTVQADPRAHKVCYAVNAKGASTPLSGGLMKGGTSVVTFKPARNGALDGCADVDPAVAQGIVDKPSDYTVSINNGALTATLNANNNFQ